MNPEAVPRISPVDGSSFWWAVGIEDTFVTAPYPPTGRSFDAYAMTGHDTRWAGDIDLMADLSVSVARYRLPGRGSARAWDWDWTWTDRVVDGLPQRGITPIVDLVHYGTPPGLEDAFLDPDYPRWVADYAARAAERFRGRVPLWTPLNEPRMTAWHCGRTGMWPPYGRSWRGFVAVRLAAVRGIVATVKVLAEVHGANRCVHVDAANRWLPPDPADDGELAALTTFRVDLAYLALDLVTGGVDERHPLRPWLTAHGAEPADLDSISARSRRARHGGRQRVPDAVPEAVRPYGGRPREGPVPVRHRGDRAGGAGRLLAAVPVSAADRGDRRPRPGESPPGLAGRIGGGRTAHPCGRHPAGRLHVVAAVRPDLLDLPAGTPALEDYLVPMACGSWMRRPWNGNRPLWWMPTATSPPAGSRRPGRWPLD